MVVYSAQGSWYYTNQGPILDAMSGVCNVSYLGHSQSFSPISTPLNCFGLKTVWEDEVLAALPSDYDWHLLTTGAEAVDRALMAAMAHKATPTARVFCFEGCYHGRGWAMSASAGWQRPFTLHMLARGERLPDMEADAVIYEPVQGNTGFSMWDVEYMLDWCRAHGAVLIADEMITGFGRCQEQRFASSPWSDVLVIGKNLSQGYPMSAVGLRRSTFGDTFDIPNIAWRSTYAANPVSCHAAALALRYYDVHRPHLRAIDMCAQLKRLGAKVNGSLVFYPSEKYAGEELQARLHHNGVRALARGNLVRLAPAYNMSEGDFATMIERVRGAVS